MAKKRRVPEVLWRLFRNRARTLAHTIISLVSQLPPSLLQRSGEGNDKSFLIKQDDPAEYRKLLYQCFVVVDDNAPPLSGFSPVTRWSQNQIVERCIEMIMSRHPVESNVICSSYDKSNGSSPIVELLTGPAWDLLLERVGDDFMVYLLKYTSIFLPLPPKKHHQVTGPPITGLCHKLLKIKAESQCQHPSFIQSGHQKKRKRVDFSSSMLDRQQAGSSVSHQCSMGIVGIHCRNYVRECRQCIGHSNDQINLFGAHTPRNGDVAAKPEGNSNQELQKGCNEVSAKTKKRSRPFSWQRRRNRRQINHQEVSDRTPCTKKDCLCQGCQYDFNKKMKEKCCCCLMLQAPQLVSDRVHINRRSIFYNLECSSTILPRRHVLNSLKPNFSDSKFLIENIFGLSDVNKSPQSMPCDGFCCTGSACLYHSLHRLLKILIRRSQSCQHLRLLDKHCAVPSLDQNALGKSSSLFEGNELENKVCEKSYGSCTKHCKKTLGAGDSEFEAIKPYCLKSQVVSFIWAVCRSIIPADLLGTPSNWRVLRRNISKFIQLRRFEKFSVKQCMHKLKISKFPFLSNKHSSCYLSTQLLNNTRRQNAGVHKELRQVNNVMPNVKHKLLVHWIFWLFSFLVVPLVQANFYVTESEHGKQDIYYYRKSVWEKLMNKAITSFKDKSYCQLDDAAVRSVISNRSFGFSKLRLLPKESGVRMLANLKAPSKMLAEKDFKIKHFGTQKDAQLRHKTVKFDHFKSVNGVLRDIHAVLKGLMLNEPEKLGSSVFDYNDVYKKLCPFLIGLRNGLNSIPGIFIVVSDVSKAFDSIDQDKLLSVMNEVIQKDKYLLEQTYQVVSTTKSLWMHDTRILTDHNVSNALKRFTSSLTFPSLHRVLVNQGWRQCVRKEELFFNLVEHVKRNVLQLDKKFYLQGIGIPQGSVISSLLCSLYYGHLERNVIYPYLKKAQESTIEVASGYHSFEENGSEDMVLSSPSYILLRYIDDFLFISTSKKQAGDFFDRLRRGFYDYNCYMNEEKFCVNFDIGHKPMLSKRGYVGEDGISFLRWSGLLINCSTAEVQGDYTRYLNSHLSSTLTVCWQGKPGHHLRSRLCSFMRPKCHPIFFDSNINSAAVIRLNIYQAFLLCAMKFHCYISNLSYICKLSSSAYLKIIERSLRYMHVLIKKRMHSITIGPSFHPILHLEGGEVEWLGLNAYVQVLKRKQSRHKELLSLLRSKLLAHRISGCASSELEYAIDRSHSSVIWKIRY